MFTVKHQVGAEVVTYTSNEKPIVVTGGIIAFTDANGKAVQCSGTWSVVQN